MREDAILRARVYLREARIRSTNPAQRSFCFTLLTWAANARKQAYLVPSQMDFWGKL